MLPCVHRLSAWKADERASPEHVRPERLLLRDDAQQRQSWDPRSSQGVIQRVTALNLLLHDLYHDQKIIKDGVIPADLIFGNPNYRPVMQGVDLPHRTYVNICGTDLIRDEHGTLMVLEDNARTPSGVSYVVENRHMMLRAFPDLVDGVGLRSVEDDGLRLLAALREIAPPSADAQVVLLSPGPYNSAFFEHIFLAREMGVPLVMGSDLLVEN